MSLLPLRTQKMFRISKPWVEEKRVKLQAIPEVNGIFSKIEEAHNNLFLLRRRAPETPLQVILLREEQEGVDIRHDVLIEVGHGILTLLALLTQDPEEARRLLALRDFLFPEGLVAKNRSYDEEAGAAELLAKNLTAEHESQLGAILIKPGYSMLDLVQEYILKGKRLGELEVQKKALLETAAQSGPSRSDVQKARSAWIRAARALESNLALAGVEEETLNDILGALREAEKKASLQIEEDIPDEELI